VSSRRAKRERDVEAAVVRRWPWKSIKLAGPGEVGKPDRMFLGPDAFVAFIEFKRPGSDGPTKKQADVLNELRTLGFPAEWFDDAKEAMLWLDASSP